MIDLTVDEREYLVETLKAAHTQLLHELHHARNNEFKDMLRKRVAVNERLMEKVEAPISAAVW